MREERMAFPALLRLTSFAHHEAMKLRRSPAVSIPPKKVRLMEALQAFVLTNTQLREMLTEAARQGAAIAVAELREELNQSPEAATLQKLRAYLADPTSLGNPNEHWAHAGLICQIRTTTRGKPKSAAWFMKFQRETGLNACPTRPSPAFGRRKEWTFSDIKLAWDAYYRRR